MMATIYRPMLLLTARSFFCVGLMNTFHWHNHHWKKQSHLQRLFSTNIRESGPSHAASSGSSILRRSQGPTALDPIEDAVMACLSHYEKEAQPTQAPMVCLSENILKFPQDDRESIGVASNLKRTLDSFARSGVHCRRCWLQKKHCICEMCVELGRIPRVERLFVLTHHKEICLAVDTAKLIYASFPQTVDLVISGVPREFQPLMGEMLDIVSAAKTSTYQDIMEGHGTKCLILFPTEDAATFEDIMIGIDAYVEERAFMTSTTQAKCEGNKELKQGWNVVVIDGTWSQARKMHSKYFPDESSGMLYRVQLSSDAVQKLGDTSSDDSSNNEKQGCKGLQLRRHPIKWREVSTLEATRLLLLDMHPSGEFIHQADVMSQYAEIGNTAVKRQIGPPRQKS